MEENPRDLGRFDRTWAGWTLADGELFDPWHTSVRGYTPTEVRTLPYLYQLIHELQRDLQALRAQEHQPRQITNLARPAQIHSPKIPREDPRMVAHWRVTWRGAVIAPVQAGLPRSL